MRRERVYTAVRARQPIVVDGDLDEAAWAAAPLAGDFFQIDPRAGVPADVRTEFRVLFDDEHVYVLRVDIAFSSRMFLNTLTQYNTDARTVASNVRFRFIHHPLSDIFVVYNDSRGILGSGELNRTLSIKFTHLFSL